MKQYMEICNYKITEGDAFGWPCFGSNAYNLSTWNGDHDGHSLSIVFDTETQVVYMVEAHDYKGNVSYRLINPDYQAKYKKYVKTHEIDDEAYDGVPFIDLEIDEDYIQKATAIVNGMHYDRRIQVPLNLNDEEIFKLMKLAHDRDVTLNELIENILNDLIESFNQKTAVNESN